MTAPPSATTGQRLVFLDALRGIAATWVVLFHVGLFDPTHLAWLPRPIVAWIQIGDLGVEIFFVLSGFVIAYSLRDAKVTPGFVARFIVRRSVRLDPPYWTMLAVSLLLTSPAIALLRLQPFESIFQARVILANLAYVHHLLHLEPILGVAWTLCIEIQFYLVYAALLGACQALGRRQDRGEVFWQRILIGGMFAASLAWAWWANRWPLSIYICHWFWFYLGVCALRAWLDPARRAEFWLAVFLVVSASLAWRTPTGFRIAWENLVGISTTLVIYGLAVCDRLHRVGGHFLLRYFGRISYSLYLVHVPAILVTYRLLNPNGKGLTGPVTSTAIALLVSVMTAEALCRFVEEPSQRLSKWITLTGPAPGAPKETQSV